MHRQKRSLFLIIFPIIVHIFLFSPVWAATVKVEPIHSSAQYKTGGTYPLLFRLRIEKPWYIHGIKKGEDYLIPTKLLFNESPSLKVKGIRFPEPEKVKFEYTTKPIEVYSGEILVGANLSVDDDTQTGKHIIKGSLSYQACSPTSCLPPKEVPIEMTFLIVPPDSHVTVLNKELFLSGIEKGDIEQGLPYVRFGAGFWLTLFGIFAGGLALNLTPCIYPLIPITVSYFGGRSERIKSNTILHGILYILGLAVTNSVLGVSSALSGRMLGSVLQNPILLIFVACVMTALSLSFFGFWELRLPTVLTRTTSKNYGGYFGTFFIGLTLGIVAAPCLGPFILGLLTYVGQRGDPILGFLYFFVLSIGIGLPLCILAVFSGAIDRLPRSGDWMLWIRRFMGWVLIGMAAFIISPIISHTLTRSGLLVGVAFVAGIHLGWLDKSGRELLYFSHIKKVSGLIIIAFGLIYLISIASKGEGIKWIPYNQEIISEASEENRPIILDFYADWCLPCRDLDNRVFSDPTVVKLSQKFITMRLDLTKRQPFQEEILSLYKVMGVPTVIFINGEGIEERNLRIESLVERSEYLKRMKQLLSKSDL